MTHISNYSSPFNLGHKALEELWDGVVVVQEKIDGSQFSFRRVGDELQFRSRGAVIDPANAGMFSAGVQAITELSTRVELPDGWTFRGEYLQKPKHNTLAYGRVPKHHVIIYDIDMGECDYLLPVAPAFGAECSRLGLEFLTAIGALGNKPTLEQLTALIPTESILGGKSEGIVLKNYAKFAPDKKVLMAKLVTQEFKETHSKDWKERNPSGKDFVAQLTEKYATEARWQKAVQHMAEAGLIEGDAKDIGLLLREVGKDVLKDHEQEIKDALFKHFWPQMQRGITRGLPEWYKNKLASEAIE